MTLGWKQAKRIKMRQLDQRCEECHCRFPSNQLILHHIVNRRFGGRNTLANARLRDRRCEQLYHYLYPDGNKPGGSHEAPDRHARNRPAGRHALVTAPQRGRH